MKESDRLDALDLVDLLKEGLMVVQHLGLNGQTVFTTVSFTPRKPTVTATTETGAGCSSRVSQSVLMFSQLIQFKGAFVDNTWI